MRRAQRWGRFIKFLWWAVIVGTSAAAYIYLQPILLGLLETYQKILSGGAPVGSPSILLDKGLTKQILDQIKSMIDTLR